MLFFVKFNLMEQEVKKKKKKTGSTADTEQPEETGSDERQTNRFPSFFLAASGLINFRETEEGPRKNHQND